MTARQESKLSMYRAVEKYCSDNAPLVTTNISFNDAFTDLESDIASILSSSTSQVLKIKGKSASKAAKRTVLAQSACDLANIVYAYATQQQDSDLQGQVKFSFSELMRQKDDILAQDVTNIYNVANDNLANLADAGVTKSTLKDLQTKMDNYSTAVPGPKNARAERQSSRLSLTQLFKSADNILKNRMDKLVRVFNESDPEFVATYKVTRRIDDPATRKKVVKKISKAA